MELTPSSTQAYAFLSRANQLSIFRNVIAGLRWVEEPAEELQTTSHITKGRGWRKIAHILFCCPTNLYTELESLSFYKTHLGLKQPLIKLPAYLAPSAAIVTFATGAKLQRLNVSKLEILICLNNSIWGSNFALSLELPVLEKGWGEEPSFTHPGTSNWEQTPR